MPANEYAVSVFEGLCTQLNMDFPGLAVYAAEQMGLDLETLRKVNVIWSVFSERKNEGDQTSNSGRRRR